MKINLVEELKKRAVVYVEENGSVYLRDGEEVTKELEEIQTVMDNE